MNTRYTMISRTERCQPRWKHSWECWTSWYHAWWTRSLPKLPVTRSAKRYKKDSFTHSIAASLFQLSSVVVWKSNLSSPWSTSRPGWPAKDSGPNYTKMTLPWRGLLDWCYVSTSLQFKFLDSQLRRLGHVYLNIQRMLIRQGWFKVSTEETAKTQQDLKSGSSKVSLTSF